MKKAELRIISSVPLRQWVGQATGGKLQLALARRGEAEFSICHDRVICGARADLSSPGALGPLPPGCPDAILDDQRELGP